MSTQKVDARTQGPVAHLRLAACILPCGEQAASRVAAPAVTERLPVPRAYHVTGSSWAKRGACL